MFLEAVRSDFVSWTHGLFYSATSTEFLVAVRSDFYHFFLQMKNGHVGSYFVDKIIRNIEAKTDYK